MNNWFFDRKKSKNQMKFNFFIGGFMGESYKLNLENDELTCTVLEQGYEDKNNSFSVETKYNTNWDEMISFLNTRNWKPEYHKPMMDGTHWELEFESETKTIKSSGSNAYPLGFQKFLKLLNEVLDHWLIKVG